MEKWQENRNYRRIKDQNGNIVANIITVDGMDVPVTEEVYAAYAKMDRRERYLSEDVPAGRLLSLEQMAEDGVQPDYVGAETVPSLKITSSHGSWDGSGKNCPACCQPPSFRWRTGTGSSLPRCSSTTSPPGSAPGVWA